MYFHISRAVLKLSTSFFECVCFICVNIVSLSSLRASFSPRLFIALFFQPNVKQNTSSACSREK